ncbi:MAG: methylated-DNA--[protein]-cysteine S-methyltransferase [Planctomycetes bacterium]|nr:methylated-DNA--[protein]-cysteine S-methyltransferase [Planctomycetota bacterium]
MRDMIVRETEDVTESENAFPKLANELKRYFTGETVNWSAASIDLRGTPFQKCVWRAAMTIPYGETRSYGWIAWKIGRSGASRAVGGAMGRNPLPPIVPCHRVLRCDGSLGGFSAEQGVALKRKLLDLESKAGI